MPNGVNFDVAADGYTFLISYYPSRPYENFRFLFFMTNGHNAGSFLRPLISAARSQPVYSSFTSTLLRVLRSHRSRWRLMSGTPVSSSSQSR